MNYAVIELGSNISPQENIPKAIQVLGDYFSLKSKSPFSETPPIGPPHQPAFINGAVLIETAESLKKTKALLRDIENQLGRKRTADKFSPRTIDLDVIIWNGKIINEDFHNRDYVKKNVLETLADGHKEFNAGPA